MFCQIMHVPTYNRGPTCTDTPMIQPMIQNGRVLLLLLLLFIFNHSDTFFVESK